MRLLKSPAAKARMVLLLLSVALPLIYWLSGDFGFLANKWGKGIVFIVIIATILLAFRQVDRILDRS